MPGVRWPIFAQIRPEMSLCLLGKGYHPKPNALSSVMFLSLLQTDTMDNTFEDIPLTNNELSRQFELVVDNVKAKIEYDLQKDRMFLLHTEVPPALGGRGVGQAIVEKTLQYLDENNLKLVPLCSFVASYVKKHPEWKKLLAQGISL